MRIAFAGTPDVAVPSLQALVDAGHDIVAVITRPDAPAGRGRVLTPSPIAEFAHEHGLPLLKPDRLVDISEELRALAPDCIPIVAYGGLVPPALLEVPTYGWINLHFSLLPAWRGAAPVQRAIMAGDDITGATTFRLDAGLDTGPVFGTLTRSIAPDDTAGMVLSALAADGAQLLAHTIAQLPNLRPVPQGDDGVSYAGKLAKADAQVSWSRPALVIDRQIRGCTPEPGAWTAIRGVRLGLGPVRLRPDVTHLDAGALQFDDAVLVGSGSHAVQLGTVKPEGKGWMDATAWARGLREQPEHFDVD